MKIKRMSAVGSFPIVWQIKVGEHELGDFERDQSFQALEKELENADLEYYSGAMSKEEWDSVVAATDRICQETSESPVKRAALFVPVNIGVMRKPGKCAAARLQVELDKFNRPKSGKNCFNRKLEWQAMHIKNSQNRFRLTLAPRAGYAKWVEKDKLVREQDLKRSSLTESAMAVGALGYGIFKTHLIEHGPASISNLLVAHSIST